MHKFADALGLHKSATFNATVTIHELTQVPLLHGKFRIKWKFKSATSSSHAGAEISPATSNGNPSDEGPSSSQQQQHAHHHFRFGQGRASRWLHPKSALSSSVSANGLSSSTSSLTVKSSASRHRSSSGRSQDRSSSSDDDDDNDNENDDAETAPNSPPLANGGGGQALSPISPLLGGGGDPGRTPNPNRTPGPSYANAFGNTLGERNVEALYAPSGASPDSPNGPEHPGMRRRGLSEASAATSPISPLPTPKTSAPGPEPRGKTAAVGLRAHTATFNREISCPVSISLRHAAGDTKNYHLQPSPLRLTVRQQHMGDEHKLEEEKLGEVMLDLSQFVPRHGRRTEQGKPRRYLLQGCKSNTVLRVSVKMEWLDGAHDYVVPPLKSGQISSSAHSGLKGLASLHSSPANRSTSSLAKGSQNNASSARLSTSNASQAMSRTNSASSQLSSQSAARSTPSPERVRQTRSRRPKGKGWHPPHSALTSATIPMTTGTCGTGHTSDQRTAEEIIEMLFNRPVSAMGGRGSWRDPKLANDERLGEAFQYRPTVPREQSAQTETGATSRGGRFSRARKAWSIRSGKGGKSAPKEAAEFDRDLPEVPTAASYAQVEAPAEQRRQEEREELATTERRYRDMAAYFYSQTEARNSHDCALKPIRILLNRD